MSSARAALGDSDDLVLSSGIAEPALQLDGVDMRGAGAAGEGMLLVQVAAEVVAQLSQVAAAMVVPAGIATQDGQEAYRQRAIRWQLQVGRLGYEAYWEGGDLPDDIVALCLWHLDGVGAL